MRAPDVLRPETSREAIVGIVGDRNRFLFVIKRDHRDHRAEDLFPGHAHLVVNIGKHRGRDKIACAKIALGNASPSGQQPCAFTFAISM